MCPAFELDQQSLVGWLIREGASYHRAMAALNELKSAPQVVVDLPVRVGPRIVRAWFDSVFTPLIAELQTEIPLLEQRNWTFSYRQGAFEYIRPIKGYLDGPGRLNLEQVLNLNPEIETSVKRHDDLLANLLFSVISLHETTTSHERLRRMVDEVSAPESLSKMGYSSAEVVFGAYPPEDRYKLIAQYVVNHAPGQPPWMATSKLWNMHRLEFLSFLEEQELAPIAERVTRAGTSLQEASLGLHRLLEAKRLELSLAHDVPYSSVKPGLPAA